MTAAEPARLPAEAEADRAPAPSLRVEAEALLAAAIAAVLGGVVGLIIGPLGVGVRLRGDASIAGWAAAGAGLAAAVSSALGYWRARTTDGQEWRRRIASWRYVVSTASVIIAHGALAMVGTVALFAVLSRAFIDVELTAFWTTVLAATATGLSGWLSYLSASRMIVGGPWIVRRTPRAYFLASWAFLAGLVIWIALSATGYFGLMVVADQPDPRS